MQQLGDQGFGIEEARRVLGDPEPVAISGQTAADANESLPPFDNVAEPAEGTSLEIESAPPAVGEHKTSRKPRLAQKAAAQSRPGEVVVGRRADLDDPARTGYTGRRSWAGCTVDSSVEGDS